MNRRDFIEGSAAAAMLASAAARGLAAAELRRALHVGVHVAAHSFFDEGVEHALDFLQSTAEVNVLYVTSDSYYGAMFRPREAQGDHGVPIRDGRGRRVTKINFRPNDAEYKGGPLRHRPPDPKREYSGRDVFAEILGPAHRRGMEVYERMYEPGSEGLVENVRGAESILTVDLNGNRGKRACWNHPDYLAFVEAWVRDLFRQHPLDGLQFGAERNGPLSRLVDWANEDPTCFCEHCRARARREGVDVARAREGLGALTRFVRAMQAGGSAGPDGAWVSFWRVLMHHPEIFAWENMHYRAGEDLHQRVYDVVKQVRPAARVGRHIDHAQTSWDLFFRAAMPLERMAPRSEFLKLSVYNGILGPRLQRGLDSNRRHYMRDFTPEQALGYFYAWAGHDAKMEPRLEDLAAKGLSPEYVHREIKRAVDGVGGKTKIYAGVAIDIPRGQGWGTEASPSDPEEVSRCVQRAYDAGAAGIVVCREYEEMHRRSLEAVGRVVRVNSGKT